MVYTLSLKYKKSKEFLIMNIPKQENFKVSSSFKLCEICLEAFFYSCSFFCYGGTDYILVMQTAREHAEPITCSSFPVYYVHIIFYSHYFFAIFKKDKVMNKQ